MSPVTLEERVIIAAKGQTITRAAFESGEWLVETILQDHSITCIAQDPFQMEWLYAGTRQDGLLISEDAGKSWHPFGFPGVAVRSLAVSPHVPGTIYVGCKPVSMFMTRDGGNSWQEVDEMRKAKKWWWFSPAEPPEWTPYVQAITISPASPQIVMVGIEFGGVLRSVDGGETWSSHQRGALRDCHSLKFHANDGAWVYQGGGGGAAISKDGGVSWQKPRKGLDRRYGWMIAADPLRPEVWYCSLSGMPNILRGEFVPAAHIDGYANAAIYRSVDGAHWERLAGGLPHPLRYMAYALVTFPGASGHLWAGMSNGELWHTRDYGDSWTQLPFNLGGIHTALIIL